jgi:hypothetical protein
MEEIHEKKKKLNQDSLSPGQESEPGPLALEAEMLLLNCDIWDSGESQYAIIVQSGERDKRSLSLDGLRKP